MAKEIERKFLVRERIRESDIHEMSSDSMEVRQYYLVSSKDAAVRLRDQDDGGSPILTVKTGGDGISCDEFEFRVAHSHYEQHLADRKGIEIVKTRFIVPHGGRRWEIDVFSGELEGLVVAELECDDAAEVTDLPDWVGEEITYDSRYKNAVLALKGIPAASPTAQEVADRLGLDLGATSLEEQILDHVTGTDDTATRELRTRLNPFSTGANGARQVEMKESRAVSPERQKKFGEAMSRVVRADTDQIMRGEPPFDIFEKPNDGLTEGLMFAPGDAVFTAAKASDESTVEENGSVPEEGVLLHVANSGHVVTVSPHAAGVADAFSGISDDLAVELMQATKSHRYIDQSQEFILIGEVTDESSADLLKRAAAEGFKAYGKKED